MPPSDAMLISDARQHGIDVNDKPYATGAFTCDALVARKCAARGAGFQASRCASMSERDPAVPTGSGDLFDAALAGTRASREDADGYIREYSWHTCNKAPFVEGPGAVESCDARARGPVVCLQTSQNAELGDNIVQLHVPGASAGSFAARSNKHVWCTCYARKDVMGLSEPLSGRDAPLFGATRLEGLAERFPHDQQYPTTARFPYSGNAADYFEPDNLYKDPGEAAEPS